MTSFIGTRMGTVLENQNRNRKKTGRGAQEGGGRLPGQRLEWEQRHRRWRGEGRGRRQHGRRRRGSAGHERRGRAGPPFSDAGPLAAHACVGCRECRHRHARRGPNGRRGLGGRRQRRRRRRSGGVSRKRLKAAAGAFPVPTPLAPRPSFGGGVFAVAPPFSGMSASTPKPTPEVRPALRPVHGQVGRRQGGGRAGGGGLPGG